MGCDGKAHHGSPIGVREKHDRKSILLAGHSCIAVGVGSHQTEMIKQKRWKRGRVGQGAADRTGV